jgi:hypothetical protein
MSDTLSDTPGERRYWIGVASRDHVRAGVAGGFCQHCHGKASAVARLRPGDRIVYYSPRERMRDGAPVQAFTAIGEIRAGAPRQADMGDGFLPWRRDVHFFAATEAPVRPLLAALSFTRGRRNWGYVFRRGIFPIAAEDYRLIAQAMGADRAAAA